MARNDVEEGKVIAGLIYLMTIFSVVGWLISVILYMTKKDNSFVKFHFQQWLVLLIAGIIVGAVGAITMFILIGFVILIVGGLMLFVLWIIGMINAFTGKQKPLPIIGKYGEKLNL